MEERCKLSQYTHLRSGKGKPVENNTQHTRIIISYIFIPAELTIHINLTAYNQYCIEFED